MATFQGFSPQLIEFFAGLEKNNTKAWFEDHRSIYETHVKQAMLDFVAAIGERLSEVSPEFVADPRINGSVYRIYRDVRFSKNKLPYKTHTAAVFFHRYGKKHEYPGFYFQISHRGIYWGAGHFKIDSEQLTRIRAFLARNPGMWQAITADPVFLERFGEVYGERLTRPPKGFDTDHPLIDVLKMKQYLVRHEADYAAFLETDEIVDETIRVFQDAAPFVELLCIALGIPF